MVPDLLIQLLSSEMPRSIRLLDNVVRNRRTVSNLFWAGQFGWMPYFDIGRGWAEHSVERACDELVRQGDATMDQDHRVQLTAQGEQRKRQLLSQWYQPQFFDQFLVCDPVQVQQRLQLAIQSVSQAAHQDNRYIAVQTSMATRNAVRRWFRVHAQALTPQFSEELTTVLVQFPSVVADSFLATQTGYQQPGFTIAQLGEMVHQPALAVQLSHDDVIGAVIALARKTPQSLLGDLLADLIGPRLSRNALSTLRAFEAGMTVATIAERKRIRLSTAWEHLLEAAMMLPKNEFPFDRAISPDRLAFFSQHLQGDLADWSYSDLLKQDDSLSFQEFRLYQVLRSKS